MDCMIVHVPSVPAVLVEMFDQFGEPRLDVDWTTYFVPAPPRKPSVTVPSPLLTMETAVGATVLLGDTTRLSAPLPLICSDAVVLAASPAPPTVTDEVATEPATEPLAPGEISV